MGEEDIRRQALNVFRMRTLGARVVPVGSGARTLKDAMTEAMRDWMASSATTHYIIGSVAGPHPYPMMVRDFQTVIGRETRRQMLRKEGRLPDAVVACVGGGSNAAGMFYPFVRDKAVQLIGVEAAGLGLESGLHAATLMKGQSESSTAAARTCSRTARARRCPCTASRPGWIIRASAPSTATGRRPAARTYVSATDQQALDAFGLLSRLEGIIPALESAHAVAHAVELAPKMKPDEILVICLSGRGDKDCVEVAEKLGQKL